ncbi:MAG: NADH-quinone oxidoreductase subunit G [Candidatus Nanopelagicales bacterium]
MTLAHTESAVQPVELVTVSVDGIEVRVPKGMLVIRVAELMGIEIPRFCDHPLLDPVAACRMCLIEIDGQAKPQPACAIAVTDGMVIRTQRTSEMAYDAQEGVMEFLLVNHPLDCPVCDKGGECPLQNQAMTTGQGEARFHEKKRTFPKPINVSAEILLDRERCVSCARCTRFAEQIAGDPMLELLERGAKQQVGIGPDAPFDSYYSGNTIQICPVGALTSSLYRFRSRPFDLVSTPTVCEHCASGCALRTDVRRGVVTRRLAWDDPEVNEEWNCDKGRFAFLYSADGRIALPLVREDGALRVASWPEALDVAARGLAEARGKVGVLTGGRLTREDAYAYAKFARLALGSNDIDFRNRVSSDEEAQFLASSVAGRPLGPTYADLDRAPYVLLVGLETEDESPIIFLRLRKAARQNGVRIESLSPVRTRSLDKMDATWQPCLPGREAEALRAIASGQAAETQSALRQPGAVILVGERLAGVPGALSAAAELAASTGARLAWVPRRAGDRGALDAGALPGLLPGGRPTADAAARAEVATAWGVPADALPTTPGRSTDALIATILGDRARAEAEEPRQIDALLVAGLDVEDWPDAASLRAALDAVPFLVALSTHHSEVTERADVVFPVAVVAEKAGGFTDWEGRVRSFGAAIRGASTFPDGRVLAMVADSMDVPFGPGDVSTLRAELDRLTPWDGARVAAPQVGSDSASLGTVLASWRLLLDRGRLQEGEPHLAATARPTEALMSQATADSLGVAGSATVTLSTSAGSVTLPLRIADVVDGAVWAPLNSEGSALLAIGARHGSVVTVRGGAA